jgi:hypothetical protein
MSLIITVLAVRMLQGKGMQLWGFFGRIKLPMKLFVKLVGLLATLTGWIARVSSPRLLVITAPAARPGIALIGIVLGIAMLIPIPFTNMLPSIALAMVCVGQLNRDGLVVLGGLAVGLIGLAVMGVAVWAVVVLAFAVEDIIDDEDG